MERGFHIIFYINKKRVNLIVRLFLKLSCHGYCSRYTTDKGNLVYTVSPESSVYEALETLENKNLGSLVVVEKMAGGRYIYRTRLCPQGYSKRTLFQETMVRDIMTDSPVFVAPDTKIEDCMQLMTTKFIRHLPVCENGGLVGLVSIGDIVKYIISQKDYVIEHLEHYIVS